MLPGRAAWLAATRKRGKSTTSEASAVRNLRATQIGDQLKEPALTLIVQAEHHGDVVGLERGSV